MARGRITENGCAMAFVYTLVVLGVLGWFAYNQGDDPPPTVISNPCPARVLYQMIDEIDAYLAKRPPNLTEARAITFDPTTRVSRECGIGEP